MAPITEDVVRHLAGFKGDGAPVTSCYLDVDGRRYVRPQDYELQLDVMIRQKRDHGPGGKSVDADLGRIEQFVKGGLDRSRTRGLAIFSCSAHDFWRVIELPVPVHNHLAVNDTPHVRELERVIDDAFAGLPVETTERAIAVLERFTPVFQLVYLSDDPDIEAWARLFGPKGASVRRFLSAQSLSAT